MPLSSSSPDDLLEGFVSLYPEMKLLKTKSRMLRKGDLTQGGITGTLLHFTLPMMVGSFFAAMLQHCRYAHCRPMHWCRGVGDDGARQSYEPQPDVCGGEGGYGAHVIQNDCAAPIIKRSDSENARPLYYWGNEDSLACLTQRMYYSETKPTAFCHSKGLLVWMKEGDYSNRLEIIPGI